MTNTQLGWRTWVLTDGAHLMVDTILHEGRLWLVPEWLHNSAQGTMQPARLIPLDRHEYETNPPGSGFGDYLLKPLIPKEILFGDPSPETRREYGLAERPDIHFPSGSLH